MKLVKSLALISLSSLLAFGTANAETNQKQQQQKQTQKQQSQKQQQQKQQQKKQNNKALSAEESLKLFNKSFGIRLLGHRVANGTNGKPNLTLKYEYTNKSDKAIGAVKYIGGFTHNNQIIYAQEIPLTFNTPLKAKEKVVLDIVVPFEKVPEAARPILTDNNIKLGTLNGAQALVFSDKTGVVIK